MKNPVPRDRAIERLLQSARLDPHVATAACLDADTVSAWADGGLARAERAAAEQHAAGCARCQALLAAMARTEPVPAGRTPWWSRTAIRWALPLTAAAAVALWVAVDRERAPAPASVPAVQQAPPPVASRETPSSSAASPEALPPAATFKTHSQDAKATPAPLPRERDVPRQRGDRSAPGDRMTMKDAAPPPAPGSVVESVAVAPPVAASPLPDLPRAEATPGEAAAQSRRAAGVEERVSGTERRFKQAASSQGWTVIDSPDRLVRWRFSARGHVERSTDAGATWTPQLLGVTGLITTGSAPSATVCWLAGRAGLVLRFTIPGGWQRVTLPTAADVASIVADDAERATVVLADGRRLITVDGGAEWK